jgi:hypothetical protein
LLQPDWPQESHHIDKWLVERMTVPGQYIVTLCPNAQGTNHFFSFSLGFVCLLHVAKHFIFLVSAFGVAVQAANMHRPLFPDALTCRIACSGGKFDHPRVSERRRYVAWVPGYNELAYNQQQNVVYIIKMCHNHQHAFHD